MTLRSRIQLVKRAFGMQATAVGSSLSHLFSAIVGIVSEPFTGAWQRAAKYDSHENLLRNSAVYACVTGIASDVAKMRIKLCRNDGGIWTEITENQPWLSVLRKPNHYQNRIQFLTQWILSKLLYGNAYILKERDGRGVVSAMYVLDPHLVTPLVTQEGNVYYSLNPDPLSGITDATIVVQASEIIHDRMPALWHPLIGVPPIYACAMSGSLGNKIQRQAMTYFENEAMPGGVLTIPGDLEDDELKKLKEKIASAHSGENRGKMMVLTGGMEFKEIQAAPKDTQLADILKLTVEEISRAFHYPIFKLGGAVPALAGNIESLITTYYTDCLQHLIESLELCLDEGLALPNGMGTEMDLDNLFRMDISALFDSNSKAVDGGWMKPDEARFRANLSAVPGGNTPYMQQQNFSLAALSKRDAKEDPFASNKPVKTPAPAPQAPPPAPAAIASEDLEHIYAGEMWNQLEKRKELAA